MRNLLLSAIGLSLASPGQAAYFVAFHGSAQAYTQGNARPFVFFNGRIDYDITDRGEFVFLKPIDFEVTIQGERKKVPFDNEFTGVTRTPTGLLIGNGQQDTTFIEISFDRSTPVDLTDLAASGTTARVGFGGASKGNLFVAGGPASYLASAVPEPATWAMMIAGIGIAGGTMRHRRRIRVAYA